MVHTLKRYFQESFQDLHRVTWPTRAQAVRISVIVLVFTAISAAILGATDQLLTLFYQLFI